MSTMPAAEVDSDDENREATREAMRAALLAQGFDAATILDGAAREWARERLFEALACKREVAVVVDTARRATPAPEDSCTSRTLKPPTGLM
jgi:hypothetical protein